MEMLFIPGQPKRYVVTNSEKIILVTHDLRFAEKISYIISQMDAPKNYYLKI